MAQVTDEEKFREKTNVFNDREHAGILLSNKLDKYRKERGVFIVAIPVGGIPVAYMISKNLNLPLEVAITRKLHVPWNPEVGFGAVTWNGVVEINETLVKQLGLSAKQINEIIEEEKKVIDQRRRFYDKSDFPNFKDKHPILVDDGLASGFSMLTTAKAIKLYNPKMITVAVPTAPLRSIERLKPHVDQIYCLNIRSGLFFAVASAYKVWYDLTDEEVIDYLKK